MASRPPTKKQLAYLRRLVRAQGQSFTKPKSMQEASEQIDRLTKSMSAEARAWGSQMSNAERELARNKARLEKVDISGTAGETTLRQRGYNASPYLDATTVPVPRAASSKPRRKRRT